MKVKAFLESLNGKTIGFIGIARSNLPVMELFHSYGAKIVARDARENLGEETEILDKISADKILGKENYLSNLNEDMILRSPGVPYMLPEIQEAVTNNVNVTSEMELFFELCPCKIYAVTGSDGKTTTTSIISTMLKAAGKRVHLGGNIGTPLLPKIREISPHDYAVVELSSFQLISMRKSPTVAVVTNLSPNHLDVHADMEEYVNAKKNIFAFQRPSNRLVLNLDNDITVKFTDEARAEIWGFSKEKAVEQGAYFKNGIIYVDGEELMRASDIKIPGVHNVENYMAAACAVWGEVEKHNIIATAKTFGGVVHRTEFVREFDGVKYYNDSIATSPSRTMSGTLNLYSKKIILIAGGADKGVAFDELGEMICDKVKVLILVKPKKKLDGFKESAADKISEAVMKSKKYHNGNPLIIRVKNMDEAVNAAREIASNGDVVSLSPACTAFDMYKSFEVRGNHYKEIVMKLHNIK